MAQILPLALDYLSVSGAHPVEHVEAAAASGFAYVGLRLVAPPDTTLAHDFDNNPQMLRETLEALKKTGVRVLAPRHLRWLSTNALPARPAF